MYTLAVYWQIYVDSLNEPVNKNIPLAVTKDGWTIATADITAN